MTAFNWFPQDGGFRCKVTETITLAATPDRYAKGFNPKALRGTKWHAQATHWNEATRTASRYGRDEYLNLQTSAELAMRLAEDIYLRA